MIKKDLPIVARGEPMRGVIPVMTSSRLGVAVVVDEHNKVIGIVTDGDLRRALNKYENLMQHNVEEIMTKNPKTIERNLLLYEAENILRQYDMNHLIVINEECRCIGLLLFHNL